MHVGKSFIHWSIILESIAKNQESQKVTTTKTLTIFIPTYNREQYLSRQLKFLTGILRRINKSKALVNVIISDNGSDDNTSLLAEQYENKFSWVASHRQPRNVGFDGQFDTLVTSVLGDYLWILGDDDLIHIEIVYILHLLSLHDKPLFLPICTNGMHLGASPVFAIGSFEDCLNRVKSSFQFISSWIIPSSAYCDWVKIARALCLDDPQCLATLGVIYDSGLLILNKRCISPLPSLKPYQDQLPTLSYTISIFWLRPKAALNALASKRAFSDRSMHRYRAWEDKQLLKVVYISLRDNPDGVSVSELNRCIDVANGFVVRKLLFAIKLMPVASLAAIARAYSRTKIVLSGLVSRSIGLAFDPRSS